MFQCSFIITDLTPEDLISVLDYANSVLQQCDSKSFKGFMQTAYDRGMGSYLNSRQYLTPTPSRLFDFDGDTLSPALDAKEININTQELRTLEAFIWARIWEKYDKIMCVNGRASLTLGDLGRSPLTLLWVDKF